jgi:hypothetical protein
MKKLDLPESDKQIKIKIDKIDKDKIPLKINESGLSKY